MGNVRVEIQLRNAILWGAIQRDGGNTRQFCLRNNLSSEFDVGKLLNFKKSPRNARTGDWILLAKKLAEVTGILVDFLFPDDLYDHLLKVGAKHARTLQFSTLPDKKKMHMELLAAPADSRIRQREKRAAILKKVHQLPRKRRRVLIRRFGLLDDPPQTLQEIGDALHVSREAVRCLEVRALADLAQTLPATIVETTTYG